MIIDGKEMAKRVKQNVIRCMEIAKVKPQLAVIVVGNNPASDRYVRNKERDCAEVGIDFVRVDLDEYVGEDVIKDVIQRYNTCKDVHGIIVQLPLPEQYDAASIINTIDPAKDVDHLSPQHAGRLRVLLDTDSAPCTPAAVMVLLKKYDISLVGKTCTIIGRSNLVGMPLACLMTLAGATVTVCHSKTKDLAMHCRNADIIISAAGKAKLVTADMVKDGAVVVDVGINLDDNGKLCGDVCFDEVHRKASYITPVPGGVGPMTRAMLLESVMLAAVAQKGAAHA